jgi:hypothetical protein
MAHHHRGGIFGWLPDLADMVLASTRLPVLLT